mgnify:CR=1 FL=1
MGVMTKSFDEWINDNGFNFRPEQYDLYKSLYEAGQQSKQAAIDSLHKNIDALHVENERIQKEYSMMFDGVQGHQKTIDELQKRIDVLSKKLNEMAHIFLDDLDEILKGNTNEH